MYDTVIKHTIFTVNYQTTGCSPVNIYCKNYRKMFNRGTSFANRRRFDRSRSEFSFNEEETEL